MTERYGMRTISFPARLLSHAFVGILFICMSGLPIRGQSKTSTHKVSERAKRYEPIIIESAKRHGVDPRLLWAIAWLETKFDPSRISHKGAKGLMQFMPATASRYGLADPHDPAAAIDAAARYVRDLAVRFQNRADLVLAAYNSGEETVAAFLTGRTIKAGDKIINPKGIITGGIPPYRETRRYVAQGKQLIERIPLFLKVIELIAESCETESFPARSLVRKSIRVDIGSENNESSRPRSEKASSRRSIYFEIESEKGEPLPKN